MATIQKDVETTKIDGPLSMSDAEEAFLSRWNLDAEEEPSKDDKGATVPDDTSETVEEPDENEETEEVEEETEDQTEESDETEDDDKADDKFVDDDNVKVKVKVGDEELAVSVKDLKRLYGQEASLTKKSQEVAQKRKEVEEQGTYHLVGLQKLYEKAVERYKPYAEIDMLVASKQMDTEELSILRQEAAKAYEDVRFMESELKQFASTVERQRGAMLAEQAKLANETLKDPEKGIPNWSQETYKQVYDYAVANGMPAQIMNQIIDPFVIKAIWKSMNYDKGKQVATVKKTKTPTKILKSKTNPESSKFASDKASNAMNKLRTSGSRDDAANAFLSRWNVDSDE